MRGGIDGKGPVPSKTVYPCFRNSPIVDPTFLLITSVECYFKLAACTQSFTTQSLSSPQPSEMSKHGTSNTSPSEFLPNTSSASVTGNTHNHVEQDSHSTTTNNYNQCNHTYNHCTVTFNSTSPTTSSQTGTASTNSAGSNKTKEHPVAQNRASDSGTDDGLSVLAGDRWTIDTIRQIIRRQLIRDGTRAFGGLDDVIAEAIQVEVEDPQGIGARPGSIDDAAVHRRARQ
ncbi:hypothetical protein V5O48_017443 [Marasmius crinis-equi]|uniref:Uncharacterized protein n=1 Tax=Marasmius crinis-equi TaxID=585013 RepID=A0ABR3ENZ6_9AGAR